jgi:hypothetical protein
VARSLRGPFSVGAGLTIDEFALWIYLDDVYWAEEGRSSIDAAVISAGLMLLVLLGRSAVRIFHRERRPRRRRLYALFLPGQEPPLPQRREAASSAA